MTEKTATLDLRTIASHIKTGFNQASRSTHFGGALFTGLSVLNVANVMLWSNNLPGQIFYGALAVFCAGAAADRYYANGKELSDNAERDRKAKEHRAMFENATPAEYEEYINKEVAAREAEIAELEGSGNGTAVKIAATGLGLAGVFAYAANLSPELSFPGYVLGAASALVGGLSAFGNHLEKKNRIWNLRETNKLARHQIETQESMYEFRRDMAENPEDPETLAIRAELRRQYDENNSPSGPQ